MLTKDNFFGTQISCRRLEGKQIIYGNKNSTFIMGIISTFLSFFYRIEKRFHQNIRFASNVKKSIDKFFWNVVKKKVVLEQANNTKGRHKKW